MTVSYQQPQRDRAKADQVPLVTFDFDDRHVDRDSGGGYGRMTFQGPMSRASAVKLRAFVETMIRGGELK